MWGGGLAGGQERSGGLVGGGPAGKWGRSWGEVCWAASEAVQPSRMVRGGPSPGQVHPGFPARGQSRQVVMGSPGAGQRRSGEGAIWQAVRGGLGDGQRLSGR